jgi:hypothetical protein
LGAFVLLILEPFLDFSDFGTLGLAALGTFDALGTLVDLGPLPLEAALEAAFDAALLAPPSVVGVGAIGAGTGVVGVGPIGAGTGVVAGIGAGVDAGTGAGVTPGTGAGVVAGTGAGVAAGTGAGVTAPAGAGVDGQLHPHNSLAAGSFVSSQRLGGIKPASPASLICWHVAESIGASISGGI